MSSAPARLRSEGALRRAPRPVAGCLAFPAVPQCSHAVVAPTSRQHRLPALAAPVCAQLRRAVPLHQGGCQGLPAGAARGDGGACGAVGEGQAPPSWGSCGGAGVGGLHCCRATIGLNGCHAAMLPCPLSAAALLLGRAHEPPPAHPPPSITHHLPSCPTACPPALQNWLYEDGEDEVKSVYVAKLGEMRKLGDPVEARAANAAALPAAADSLRRTCQVGGVTQAGARAAQRRGAPAAGPAGLSQGCQAQHACRPGGNGQADVLCVLSHCRLHPPSPTPPCCACRPHAELPGGPHRAPHRSPGGGGQAEGGGGVPGCAGLAGREGAAAAAGGQGAAWGGGGGGRRGAGGSASIGEWSSPRQLV